MDVNLKRMSLVNDPTYQHYANSSPTVTAVPVMEAVRATPAHKEIMRQADALAGQSPFSAADELPFKLPALGTPERTERDVDLIQRELRMYVTDLYNNHCNQDPVEVIVEIQGVAKGTPRSFQPTKEEIQAALTVHFGKQKHCYHHKSKWFFLRRTADKNCSAQAWAEVVAYDVGMGLVLSPAYGAAAFGVITGGTLAFSLATMATAVPASIFAIPAMMYEPFRRGTPLRKYPNRLNQAAWSGANLVVYMSKAAIKNPAV